MVILVEKGLVSSLKRAALGAFQAKIEAYFQVELLYHGKHYDSVCNKHHPEYKFAANLHTELIFSVLAQRYAGKKH